jgi:hypothetical protein
MQRMRLGWPGIFTATSSLVIAGVAGTMLLQSRRTTTQVEELRADVTRVKQARSGRTVIVRQPAEDFASVAAPVPAAVATSAPHALQSAAEPEELTPEEVEHRAKVVADARTKACEDAYSAETADPDWSARAAQSIRERYSSEEFRDLRLSVDCRHTLCRVDFSFDQAQSGLQAVRKLVESAPWEGTRLTRVDVETRTGSSYVAREGFDIPDVDPASLQF